MSRPSQVHVQSPQSLAAGEPSVTGPCAVASGFAAGEPSVTGACAVASEFAAGEPSVTGACSVGSEACPDAVQTSSYQTSDIWNPARDTPIRYDATDARPSAALPQSSQVLGGYKAGPWNNRSSHARRRSRTGAGAFGPVQAPTEPAWTGPQLASDRQRTRVGLA